MDQRFSFRSPLPLPLLLLIIIWAFSFNTLPIISATPTPLQSQSKTHILHEKRTTTPPDWTKLPSTSSHLSSLTIPVRIALTQENLHNIDTYLTAVSDPSSPEYGQHWSRDRIRETFRPRRQRVEEVVRWLVREGVGRERIRVWGGGAWVGFGGEVGEVERLLRCRFGVWRHRGGGVRVGSEEYWVPR